MGFLCRAAARLVSIFRDLGGVEPTMQILYLCDGLRPDEWKRDENALRQFPAVLGQIAPEMRCSANCMSNEIERAILEAINHEGRFQDRAAAAVETAFEKTKQLTPLVVCCRRDSALAMSAVEANPTAIWGARCGQFAAVYRHDPYVIWHEVLHLLGAQDCYPPDAPEEDRLPTCGNQNCIMQYAPTNDRVGYPPFLCAVNVERMRDQFSKSRQLSPMSNQ